MTSIVAVMPAADLSTVSAEAAPTLSLRVSAAGVSGVASRLDGSHLSLSCFNCGTTPARFECAMCHSVSYCSSACALVAGSAHNAASCASMASKQRAEAESAATRDDPSALYLLGVLLDEGVGGAADARRALDSFSRAAAAGHAGAAFRRGLLLSRGVNGAAPDAAGAYAAFVKASDAGHPLGTFYRGVAEFSGVGTPASAEKGVAAFRTAAALGVVDAQFNLACCYATGTGVPKIEKAMAAELFLRAAQAGDVQAQFNIADCYRHGVGVETNAVESARWYGSAASAGHSRAKLYYARCQRDGDGVPVDKRAAFLAFHQATNAGDIAATRDLGDCFLNGIGTPVDKTAANECYTVAKNLVPPERNYSYAFVATVCIVGLVVIAVISSIGSYI